MTGSTDPRVVALEGVQEELELLRGDVRSTRETTSDRIKAMRRLLFGFFALTLVAGLASLQSRQAVNDIIAARKDARVGLCSAIDDMRVKHNHFVQTAIDERQSIIDQTDQSAATPEQKAANRQFFEAQIVLYRQDLLTVIDCNNPDALASLFTKPGG